MAIPVDVSIYEQRNERIKKRISGLSSDLLRVTFCGKFKSGKSSLINSFLGIKLLPVKSVTATAVITKVFYADKPSAYVVKDGRTINISFGDIDKYILAEDKTLDGVTTSGVSEVCIGIPLELLNRVMIIDTPGLDDDDKLTEVTLREIKNTDLAVIVYDANQLLSQSEKITLQEIDETLCGNVVFAVNRIDQLTEGSIDDIKDAANQYLSRFGNNYIGKGKIFYTVANEKAANIVDFSVWLRWITNSSSYTGNITKLSRLSILKGYLEEDMYAVNQDIANVESKVSELEIKIKEIIHKKTADKNNELNYLKNNLAQFKLVMLSKLNDECLEKCRADLTKLKDNVNWRSTFSADCKNTVVKYFEQFFSIQRIGLLKKYNLSFISTPSLTVSNTFADVAFPGADSSSGWGGAAAGAGIGTAILPGVGTAIGAGIGKFVSWYRADNKAVENCIPAAMTIVTDNVIPKVKKLIETFFDEIDNRIRYYQKNLTFKSGYEDELNKYREVLNKLLAFKSGIKDSQEKASMKMEGLKKGCKIV